MSPVDIRLLLVGPVSHPPGLQLVPGILTKLFPTVLAAAILLGVVERPGAAFDGNWLLRQCEAVEPQNIRKANKERFIDEVTAADELSRYASCTAYVAGALHTVHSLFPARKGNPAW